MRNFFTYFWQPLTFSATQAACAASSRTPCPCAAQPFDDDDGRHFTWRGSCSNPLRPFFPFLFFFCPIPALPSPPAHRSAFFFDPTDPKASRPATKNSTEIAPMDPVPPRKRARGGVNAITHSLQHGENSCSFSYGPGIKQPFIPWVCSSIARTACVSTYHHHMRKDRPAKAHHPIPITLARERIFCLNS